MRTRNGYALFQLLAAMGVVLLLLGLLLPAIQQVRLAAARMSSQNNLKQLGLAAHSFHDVHNRFPAGQDANNYSCLVHLLPYIEQNNLYRLIDLTEDLDKSKSVARATYVKTFLSPLDPIAGAQGAAPTNYMVSAGSKAGLADNDGVFFQTSAVRIVDITDGASTTLMFIETLKGDGGKKALTVQRQHVRLKKADLKDLKDASGTAEWKAGKNIVGDRGASWMDGRFLKATLATTRGLNAPEPDVDCEGVGGHSGPRSLHDFTSVGLCDGSVRTFSGKTPLVTWKAIASRAGGEVVDID